MPFNWIIKRLRAQWRRWVLLLFVMSIISGFVVFVPLNIHTLSEDQLYQRLDTLTPLDGQVILSHPTPFDAQIFDIVRSGLGTLFTSMEPFRRTTTQDLICGGVYSADAEQSDNARSNHCHQISAYDAGRLNELVTLTAGRFPQPLENAPTNAGDTQLHFETVVFAEVAEYASIAPGDYLEVGAQGGFTAKIEVVGIVEATTPDFPFWSGQELLTKGANIPVGMDIRYDFGFVVLPEVFETLLTPTIPDNVIYVYRFQTDPSVLTASQLEDRQTAWLRLEQQITQIHPDITITATVDDFIASVRAEISTIGGTIMTFAGALTTLMAAQLLYFALETLKQTSDWQTLTDRGLRHRQIIGMQVLTVTGLCMVASLVGVIAAPLWLLLLGRASGSGLPPEMPISGILGGMVIGAGIGLAVHVAAIFYLLMLRHFPAKAPTAPPFMVRFFLDIILLVIGLGLLLRLHFFRSDTRDPFDLIAPLLVLMGGAIFVLRVIPLISSGASYLWKRGLLVPMTLWHFGRQTGYKSWGLVLLMLTLSIGIIQITLRETQSTTWLETARNQTGGDVRVSFEDSAFLNEMPPESAALMPLVYLRDGSASIYTIIGIDPEAIAAFNPEWQALVQPLIEAGKIAPSGMLMPDETAKITLKVYAAPPEEGVVQVRLDLLLRDAIGANLRLQMSSPDETNTGSFVTYEAALPETGRPPYRLQGIQIRSQLVDDPSLFSHAINIDDLTVVDDQGRETVLGDFEENRPEWQNSPEFRSGNVTYVHVGSVASSGERSLVMNYRMTPGQEVVVPVAPRRVPPLPVLVSTRVAESFNARAPLTEGIIAELNTPLPLGTQVFSFEVAGVIPSFPTTAAGEHVIIADADNLLLTLNNVRQRRTFYDWNQAWIKLDTPEPSPEIQAYLENAPGVTSVTYLSERYHALGTQPIENALSDLLRVGFSLLLVLTILIFAAEIGDQPWLVLTTLGWSGRQITLWRVLEVMLQWVIAATAGLMGGVLVVSLLMSPLFSSAGNVLVLPWTQFLLGGIVILLLLTFTLVAKSWFARSDNALR